MSLSLLFALIMMGAWCLVIGEFSFGQAILGSIFGSLLVLVTGAGSGRVIPLSQLPRRVSFLCAYLLLLIPYDIVRSNLDMAWRILRRSPSIRPGIVRVWLGDVSEATSALFAHAITMTPGEMVIDYSSDGRTLYVHLIDVTKAEARNASFWRIYYRLLEGVFP